MAGRSWQQIFTFIWFLLYALIALIPALSPLGPGLIIFAFGIALAIAANK